VHEIESYLSYACVKYEVTLLQCK